jgi:ABC-type polysaccharide/polyol phosphate transport system ATPase subunit
MKARTPALVPSTFGDRINANVTTMNNDVPGVSESDQAAPAGRVVVVVENLTGRFGAIVAVDEVTFTVGSGEEFGPIGANGA